MQSEVEEDQWEIPTIRRGPSVKRNALERPDLSHVVETDLLKLRRIVDLCRLERGSGKDGFKLTARQFRMAGVESGLNILCIMGYDSPHSSRYNICCEAKKIAS